MYATSQYMDKQIMDLSSLQSTATAYNGSSVNDFFDLMNRQPEKDGTVPGYEFMPIRPAVGSSSPLAARASKFDSGDGDALLSTWNPVDSKINACPVRNYGSVDAGEPADFNLEKNERPSNETLDMSLVSEIDKTVKNHMDNLMHAVGSMSARLSQLETRARNLENSIDDLKVSVGNNHGNSSKKMSLLENILREVQSGFMVIKDKQEILEAQLEMSNVAIPRAEQGGDIKNMVNTASIKTGVSAHQQFSTVSLPQLPPTLSSSNVPLPPPHQNLQRQDHLPNQFPQNHVPLVIQQESYVPLPNQMPENQSQQYQMPPPQLQQPRQLPAPPMPLHQCQSSPTQFSQPPPSSLPHSSFSVLDPAIPQPQLGHRPEETPYILPETYSPVIHLPPTHPSTEGPPLSQQYYEPNSNAYEPLSSRPGSGYSGSFSLSSGHGELYPYCNSPSKHDSNSQRKPQQLPYPATVQIYGSGYPQLPSARILPQALPTASPVSGESLSGGSNNNGSIDDVVNRVTSMGFPRDHVRAAVRRLTDSGQAVDLNVVLDRLMNNGEGQALRGWFRER